MLPKSRLIIISLFISSALIACGDSSESTSSTPVEAGTSEQATVDKLGAPTVTQSRTIDALTFTQSEWTSEAGTTSVQFQNGKVTFSQFSPVANAD
ncbi:MAG: hypothetical protein PSN44_02600 [Gammaproteobacteria bacterium]|nr:hypothetical protein [Gammaproteobacteria bacterium]